MHLHDFHRIRAMLNYKDGSTIITSITQARLQFTFPKRTHLQATQNALARAVLKHQNHHVTPVLIAIHLHETLHEWSTKSHLDGLCSVDRPYFPLNKYKYSLTYNTTNLPSLPAFISNSQSNHFSINPIY